MMAATTPKTTSAMVPAAAVGLPSTAQRRPNAAPGFPTARTVGYQMSPPPGAHPAMTETTSMAMAATATVPSLPAAMASQQVQKAVTPVVNHQAATMTAPP